MSITTYAELKTAVAAYLHRTDLTTEIPDFIVGVENDLAYGVDLPTFKADPLRVLDMTTRATASISNQYEDWPTDALGIRNIQINGTETRRLVYLTPEQIDRRWGGSTTGEPKMYTNIGRQFQFAPAPDSTYTCEIAYYKKYTAFSADADTNWLLANSPFIYLYGALAHASDFIQDSANADRWYAKFAGLVNGLNGSENRARHSGGALRIMPR